MEGRGFMFPVDTLISNTGRMHTISRAYTPADSQKRVTLYDINSEFYGIYGRFGEGIGEFKWPSAIAEDQQGNVYITDETLNRINIYTENGDPVGHWGTSGNSDGEMDGPAGISFDFNNDLYVTDHLNGRVQKYTKDGDYLLTFGEGDLNLPWGVHVSPNGSIYVADWGNHRIVRYSADGSILACYGSHGGGDGQFKNPSSVAVDTDGNIYVADWGNERVQILDSTGNFICSLRGEATISLWGQEFLDANYEEAEPRSRSNLEPDVSLFNGNPHEESAHIEKFFWGPTSVKLDNSGRLYVTESNRHRIQVYCRL
tara:strand:+ start:7481 stop:8422 length:942 start_codon:yes stop_codon:yes gene_type:complete